MKKFLFTLAALLMAGSLYADNYLYIEDFEVAQADMGDYIEVPVMAHFDQYVSAWQVNITLPDGLTFDGNAEAGEDMTISYINDKGKNKTYTLSLSQTVGETTAAFIAASQQEGYYEVDGAWVSYGAIKWEPGDYEEMFILYIVPAANFNGGEIVVHTEPASGADPRGEVCPKNTEFDKVCTVTVEGGTVEPEVTEKPVITWEANDETQEVVITVTGAGEIVLYNDDVEVARGESPLTYTVPYTDDPEGEEMGFSATAQEEGKEVSEYALATVEVPGKPQVVPDVTPKPIIEVLTDMESETVTVRATGYGHICIYWDDQLMAEGEGVAEWVIPFGEDPEGEEYGVSATAQEEGYEVSEYALETVFVPGKAEPQPYETPAPEVVETMTDDALMITATGEGTVTIYVQTIDNETGEMTTETYEGEGTVSAVIPRGDEAYFINYWAVAQADEDAVPGSTQVAYFVEVPAKEVTPVDPSHEQGVWIVTYLVDGSEFWQEMLPSNNDYTCIVRFSYGNYGTFPYDPNKSMAENDAMRPNMPFYIVIDGVRYGAAEDGTLCVLGTALSNELFENENDYVLENALGRVYNMGVAIDELDPSKKYVYAAVAAYTEVEEMNASKTVAGVRYFNMAGQEMQEANGMTIVVTTYTDGTTSAVKVMK